MSWETPADAIHALRHSDASAFEVFDWVYQRLTSQHIGPDHLRSTDTAVWQVCHESLEAIARGAAAGDDNSQYSLSKILSLQMFRPSLLRAFMLSAQETPLELSYKPVLDSFETCVMKFPYIFRFQWEVSVRFCAQFLHNLKLRYYRLAPYVEQQSSIVNAVAERAMLTELMKLVIFKFFDEICSLTREQIPLVKIHKSVLTERFIVTVVIDNLPHDAALSDDQDDDLDLSMDLIETEMQRQLKEEKKEKKMLKMKSASFSLFEELLGCCDFLDEVQVIGTIVRILFDEEGSMVKRIAEWIDSFHNDNAIIEKPQNKRHKWIPKTVQSNLSQKINQLSNKSNLDDAIPFKLYEAIGASVACAKNSDDDRLKSIERYACSLLCEVVNFFLDGFEKQVVSLRSWDKLKQDEKEKRLAKQKKSYNKNRNEIMIAFEEEMETKEAFISSKFLDERVSYRTKAVFVEKFATLLFADSSKHESSTTSLFWWHLKALGEVCNMMNTYQVYHRNRDSNGSQQEFLVKILNYCLDSPHLFDYGAECISSLIAVEHLVAEPYFIRLFRFIWTFQFNHNGSILNAARVLLQSLVNTYLKLNQFEIILSNYLRASFMLEVGDLNATSSNICLPTIDEFCGITQNSWVAKIPQFQLPAIWSCITGFYKANKGFLGQKEGFPHDLDLWVRQFCEFIDLIQLDEINGPTFQSECEDFILEYVISELENESRFEFFVKLYQSLNGLFLDCRFWQSNSFGLAQGSVSDNSRNWIYYGDSQLISSTVIVKGLLRKLDSVLEHKKVSKAKKFLLQDYSMILAFKCLIEELSHGFIEEVESHVSIESLIQKVFKGYLSESLEYLDQSNRVPESVSSIRVGIISNLPIFSRYCSSKNLRYIASFLLNPFHTGFFREYSLFILSQKWLFENPILSCFEKALEDLVKEMKESADISNEKIPEEIISRLCCFPSASFELSTVEKIWKILSENFSLTSVQIGRFIGNFPQIGTSKLDDLLLDRIFADHEADSHLNLILKHIFSFKSAMFSTAFHSMCAWISQGIEKYTAEEDESRRFLKVIVALLIHIRKLSKSPIPVRFIEKITPEFLLRHLSEESHNLPPGMLSLSALAYSLISFEDGIMEILLKHLSFFVENCLFAEDVSTFVTVMLSDVRLDTNLKMMKIVSSPLFTPPNGTDISEWINSCDAEILESWIEVLVEQRNISWFLVVFSQCSIEKRGKVISKFVPQILKAISFTLTRSLKQNMIDLDLFKMIASILLNLIQKSPYFPLQTSTFSLVLDILHQLISLLPFEIEIFEILSKALWSSIKYRHSVVHPQIHLFLNISHCLLIKLLGAMKREPSKNKNITKTPKISLESSEGISRILEEIARPQHSSAMQSHLTAFIVSFVSTLTNSSVPNRHKIILSKGVYFLLDSCDRREYQRIYTSFLTDLERVMFKKLYTDYVKLHKFTGHV